MSQLSFHDLPAGFDWALEAEVFKETKMRSLPDSHPVLLAYRAQYITAWLATHENSAIYAIRDSYQFHNF